MELGVAVAPTPESAPFSVEEEVVEDWKRDWKVVNEDDTEREGGDGDDSRGRLVNGVVSSED